MDMIMDVMNANGHLPSTCLTVLERELFSGPPQKTFLEIV